MQPPLRNFDLLLDEVIQTNIDRYIEEKHKAEEVLQLDLIEEEN